MIKLHHTNKHGHEHTTSTTPLSQPEQLDLAIRLAVRAHAGQRDRGGAPYILHPLRVMLAMQALPQQIAAVLHDAIEDSDLTLDELRRLGIEEDIVQAIDALTKRPGETRLEAAKRAAGHGIALDVKLADNAENMNLSRIPKPGPRDYARMAEYEQVRALLLKARNARPSVEAGPMNDPVDPDASSDPLRQHGQPPRG